MIIEILFRIQEHQKTNILSEILKYQRQKYSKISMKKYAQNYIKINRSIMAEYDVSKR